MVKIFGKGKKEEKIEIGSRGEREIVIFGQFSFRVCLFVGDFTALLSLCFKMQYILSA